MFVLNILSIAFALFIQQALCTSELLKILPDSRSAIEDCNAPGIGGINHYKTMFNTQYLHSSIL